MTAVPTPPLLVHNLLRSTAASCPNAPAVTDRTGTWSYGQLWDASTRWAAWLQAQGCQTGDRVVFQAHSTRPTAALLYGCSLAGLTAVPVSPRAKPYQLRQITNDAQPTLVIARSGQLDPSAAWARAAIASPALPAGTQRAPAFLIYTSGSTSAPKGIIAPHAAVLFAVGAIVEMLNYTSDDVVYNRIPLSFDYGLYQLLLAAYAGAAVHLDDGANDAALLAEISATRSTIVPLLPPLAGMLTALAARRPWPTRVRLFTNTGEELPAAAAAALRSHFPQARLQLMYGISECKRVSILEPDGDFRRPGSVGRPLPGTRVAITGDDGTEVQRGRIGQIVVHGPHVMAGYWRASEADQTTFGRGVLRTGDYGWVDADGYLYFEGRRDDLFKLNGIRTSTREVEAAALDIPEVQAAVVLPPRHGREAVLLVVASCDEAEVLRALATRLETGKLPRTCVRLQALPLGPNGKVDRATLAARTWNGAR
ncbi:class I adenylate-forming enzyme family protein [Nonomuraea sp. NPDC050556]|uniref:class I adenylate-forming enzyme family protein n=1 Tax=Nonomuraea sp. NPDC050556 TaxID=3364369 RepID=UPI00378E81AD